MSQKKGNFVIKNASGTAKLAGLATLTNDTPNARWKDITDIAEHKDSAGIPRTLTRDYKCYELTYRITPGVGSGLASKAATVAAVTGVQKGDQFISTNFDLPELNVADADKAIIFDIGGDQAEGQLGGIDVTVRKYTDLAGTVIDFTSAWASI
jgi:hypothetical protein